jgi:RecA/RadA recombinase
MDLSHHFILLNGKAKTSQIYSIKRIGVNAFRVRFKNSPKPYTYSAYKVVWLSNPEWLDVTNSKVYINGNQKTDIREVLKFVSGEKVFWRVVHNNGYTEDDATGGVRIVTSCLSEERAKDTFAYLKDVATVNPLCNEQTGNGLLAGLYNKVDFIDDRTAMACYLNPYKYKPRCLNHADLIYPFGCNASQKKAVASAFEHQLSVIQGPPGTGKTQTILNIIANIVRQGKTVMVVSNNNSATANVQEKLEKYGLSFIVAALGRKDNKEAFVDNQPAVPSECKEWSISVADSMRMKRDLHATLRKLDRVFALQNEKAELLHEQQTIALEWKHFCMDNSIDEEKQLTRHANSERIIALWLEYQSMAEGERVEPTSWFAKIIRRLKWLWMKWKCRYRLHIENEFDQKDLTLLIRELQTLYYLNRQHEIAERIAEIESSLSNYDAKKLTATLTGLSMTLFKSSLCEHYGKHPRTVFSDVKELRRLGDTLMEQYPVVLSTTFSARSCLFTDKPYDYIIMDEASQVSIETGALALTCAYNAVIVGDTLQLPNVVTDEDRQKLDVVMKQCKIAEGYDCAKNSFLQSVLDVVKNVPETLLREHYRCHPRIINFCNQKFYGGNLLIMTEDHGEENVLYAEKTSIGNHCVNHYNQREIDVVRESILPKLQGYDSIGVVTPYNNQVKAFHRELPDVETATIHKYQGREKDAIIFSVVDNQISGFADDANLLNVAVSRAKKKFCLVVTGNEQEKKGNITDLLDYIAFNNCTVTESKLASIFDYLYSQYTGHRIAFLKSHPNISEYASENLTYALLCAVLSSENRYNCLEVLCHMPLRQVVKDTSLMSEEELKYAGNYRTHLDFLVVNRVSKQPVLAIETDGYSFHNDETEQHKRDVMKDHILSCYGLPLLRLSTKGSGEREKVVAMLNQLI